MTKPLTCLCARRALMAAGLALALAAAWAQTSRPAGRQAEVSTRDVPVVFKTKVNLVSIPVVARDSKGRAVGNLTREDFELLDNGKPQTISRFSVEKFADKERALEVPPLPTISRTGGAPVFDGRGLDSTRPTVPQASQAQAIQPAPAPAQPERYIAYVFDDVNTKAGDLARVKEVGYQHMISSLRPTERAAIYTTSGQGGTDFTDDRGKLRKALTNITPRQPITQSTDCPPMSVFQAEAITKDDVMALGAAMADILGCGGNSENAEWRSRSAARNVLALADRNIRTVLTSLDGIVKKLSLMAGRRTLLLVSSGFLMLDERREEELALLERAVRAGVVVNSLDARALWALAPGLDASSRTVDSEITSLPTPGAPLTGGTSGSGGSSLLVKNQMARAEAFASRDVMAEVAANTGGRFFENSNDLRGAYERLATAPEYIYVLGFEPQNLKLDGKYHNLKVSLRSAKGITLEARRGYYAPHSLADPGQQTKADVQDAFFSRSETNEIPITVQAEVTKASGREGAVEIVTRIDVRSLPFRKEAGVNRDDVTLVVGLFDGDGNYVKGTQKILELRLRDETLRGQASRGIVIKNSLSAPPGTYLVRVVVRDAEGQNLTAQSGSVTIP
jgi:VWFA-related protein